MLAGLVARHGDLRQFIRDSRSEHPTVLSLAAVWRLVYGGHSSNKE
jgi:hypothetical protein